ncbi:AAA family ATPase [Roseicyclus amphidinii]|uniref:AAA family ATPase n=1 Tax=Roseicyclus amphidinii TaxID=3034232 RepID=UPI0024E115E6|nr:AAA family ATPase [Roseicyclus sp. Amp-Y-6]
MNSGLALKSEPARIQACTVSEDVHRFDLLIEDMEAELGEAWGDLGFAEARAFLDQPEATELQFLAIAVTPEHEMDLGMIGELIVASKARGVKCILVAHDVGPAALRELLRLGADDFVPYPLAEGALHDAIERMRDAPPMRIAAVPAVPSVPSVPEEDASAPAPTAPLAPPAPVEIGPRIGGEAAVFAVQGIAGGTGASTLAVNLAWELANIDKQKSPSVCLLDLDLQAGTVSTFLDLPRRDMVIELLQDARSMDVDAFKQALLGYEGKLSVFPAPPDLLPLDLIGPEEVEALIGFATQCFDIVVIDMPHTLVMWTETVLTLSDVYFTTMELDMRSAQNAMRFLRALRAETLPVEKLNFVLNRAPGLTDLSGKARVKKLGESLGIKVSTQLPDGGRPVLQAGDNGQTLMESARKNPLRKEIRKLAEGLHKAMLAEAAAK